TSYNPSRLSNSYQIRYSNLSALTVQTGSGDDGVAVHESAAVTLPTTLSIDEGGGKNALSSTVAHNAESVSVTDHSVQLGAGGSTIQNETAPPLPIGVKTFPKVPPPPQPPTIAVNDSPNATLPYITADAGSTVVWNFASWPADNYQLLTTWTAGTASDVQ